MDSWLKKFLQVLLRVVYLFKNKKCTFNVGMTKKKREEKSSKAMTHTDTFDFLIILKLKHLQFLYTVFT
jgi:hypothetical protein